MDIEVSSYSMVICIVFAGVQIERELLRDTGSILETLAMSWRGGTDVRLFYCDKPS